MRNILIATAVASGLAAGAAAQEIGAVGAVNPATLGERPAAAARQLRITDRVVRNERISAGADGLAQILLLDQTTLTVGPNSDIVLDEFVFDPSADAGSVALTLTRGALRFIGGRTSKTEAATIRAPGGIVFVRGGVATVDTGDGRTRVVLWAGDNAVIEAGGQRLLLARPGAAGVIEGVGGPAQTLRYIGVVDGAVAGVVLGTFRSPGDGGVRSAAVTPEPGVVTEPGGAARPPVSTIGQLALAEDPADTALEGPLLDVLTQSPIFGREADPDSGVFVDIGGEGLVRGQLVWTNRSDLDLHLILPDGAGEVFFANSSVTFNDGGAVARLDRDNFGDQINVQPDQRVENIFVTGQAVPRGDYGFFVRGFSVSNDGVDSPFRLTVTGDGGRTTRTVDGAVGEGQNSPTVIVTVPGSGM